MKTKSVVVLFITLLTFAACQSPITQSDGQGSLSITFGLEGSRTILPDYLGQADKLVVGLTGPGGFSATQNLGARDSARFEELKVGTYTVSVEVLNFAGQVFLTGSKTFDVREGNNTESVSLDSSMSGSGSLQVDISYPVSAGIDEIQTRAYLLDSTPGPWQNVVDLDGSISLTQDLPSGYYFFEIQFFNNTELIAGIYEVAWVFDNTLSQQSFSLPLGFEIPEPPTAFTAVESGEDVLLTWNDVSLTESGFRIERMTAGGSWSLLSSLPAGSESFTDGSTEASTTYSYRIKAEGASADSPWVSLSISTGDRKGEEGDLVINITITDPGDLQDIFDTIGDLGQAEVTVSSAVQGSSSWAWHLDGSLVSSSSSYTFDSGALSNGLHILALIVEVEGQMYSESISFRVTKAESLNITSLTVDGKTLLPVGTSFSETIMDDSTSLSISAQTEDANVTVTLDGQALPLSLTDLPANGVSQTYSLTVTGLSGATKVYSLELDRDYQIDDSIDIYYFSATAPTIWFWEEEGLALAELAGHSWPGPTMGNPVDGFYHIGIPVSSFTQGLPNALNVIFDSNDAYTISPVQDVRIKDGIVTPLDTEDTEPPVLTWSPTDLTTTESSIVVSLTATDNHDSSPVIYYTQDGSIPSELSPVYTSAFTFGSSTVLRVFVVDASGNGAYYDLPIEVGVISPTVVSALPGSGDFYTDSLSITLGVRGSNISSATYSLSTGASSSYNDGEKITVDASGLAIGGSITLDLSATGDGGTDTASYTYTKAEVPEGFYSTNPGGQKGKAAAITIDGSFEDWTNDMIVAQGVANDDPRMFKGSHEGPVYDLYALYAAWDDDKLYLMWQYTNVTDVADPAQGFPISDNGKPWNGNIPISIAFDIDPTKETDGIIDGTQTSVWGDDIYNTFANGMDRLAMFSSKPGVGEPAIFKMNANGALDYEVENVLAFADYGISFLYGDGFKPETMMGINKNGWAGYTPADLLDLDLYIDFLETGHDTAQDTMYEMEIPFAALGIDRAKLESQGIGIMLVSTFGQSGIGSLPDDPANLDNVMDDYGPDSSTSAEKSDADNFTMPMARIGQ